MTFRWRKQESVGTGRPRSHDSARGKLYADDPLETSEGDALDRGRLAVQLSRVLVAVSEQSDSSVVALVGSWGSGKSSLLKGIERHLESTGGWYLAWHNPWAYSSLDGAVAGFFAELATALPRDTMGTDRRKAVGEWAARIAPLGAAGGIVGVDATGVLANLATLIAGDHSPLKLRDQAAAQLQTLEKPLLVIVDDLDRLEPAELLLTFKLVRMLGRLPNVYYLLAYDEETLIDILKHTDLVGNEPSRAQQYLEKMVQVRLDLPPMLAKQQVDFINQGIDDLCRRHSVELTTDGEERLQQAWSECLAHYMDQPRAIKRLLTQVDAFWPEVNGEVDFVDFLLMTFLRTFERETFDLVIEKREELLGNLGAFGGARRDESHKDRWARWNGLIKERHARRPEGVAVLLSELFLTLRSARENMTYGSDYRADIARKHGVGSAEYFDRYIQVGVPEGDIPERLIADAVRELRDGTQGEAVSKLSRSLATDASSVIRKLRRMDEVATLPEIPVLRLLSGFYLSAREQTTGVFGLSSDTGLLMLTMRLLDRLDKDTAVEELRFIASSGLSGLILVADALRRARDADEQIERREWVQQGTAVVAPLIEASVQEAAREPLPSVPRSVIRLLYGLLYLEGAERVHALLWELLEGDSEWVLEDLLGFMVPIGSTSNGRRSWDSLGDLGSGDVDALLGVERVLSKLVDLPEYNEAADGDSDRRQSGVSWNHRKTYAMNVVARLKRERESSAPQTGPQTRGAESEGEETGVDQ